MRPRSALFVALLSGVLAASALPAVAGSGLAPKSPASENKAELTRSTDAQRPTEILVKYRSSSKAAEARSRVDAKLVKRLPSVALEVLEPARSLDQAIATLEADPNVLYAEPNYLYQAASIAPNDPHYKALWGLAKIRMPEAWTATQGSKGVTVAVVDSGIALGHPDLAPSIWNNPRETGGGKESNGLDDDGNGYADDWRGWDWVNDDNKPADSHGHGSHVAGTIGANGNDSFGMVGVNWTTSLMPLRVLDPTGMGTSGDIAAAFTYAGRSGVDVVNASLGGSGQSTAILEAINNYPNTLFVVAAGNQGTNNDLEPQYPCNYPSPNVICVAASDKDDNLAAFSNYGPTSVDLAAPGVSILSAAPASSQPFIDSFETDIAGRWVSGGTNNLWSRGIDPQGGYLSDSVGINYLDNTDSWIATAEPFSLAGQNDCKLHFAGRLELESGNDALLVEMSRDQQSWTKVGGWTGTSNGAWNSVTDNIGAFDGAASAYLRFRLKTNSSITGQGADLDDVRVRCLSDSYVGNEFITASGTSMAAPHVSGVAALLKAAVPDATVSQLVTSILSGTQTTTGLTGRVATSGRLDAVAALEKLTGSALVQPEPSPEPSPEPEPSPTLEPEPTEAVTVEHVRKVTLKLRGSLYASGRVSVESGYETCAAGVTIKVKRNRKTIKKTTTLGDGSYRVRIPNRRGRYIVQAPELRIAEVPEQVCLAARSPKRVR